MPQGKPRRLSASGTPPGTLFYTGKHKPEPVEVTVIDYDTDRFIEQKIKKVEDCTRFKDSTTVTWINVVGLHRIDIIESIGACFDIHPLILEHIVDVGGRPRTEDFGDSIFVVFKMLKLDKTTGRIDSEQVSLILKQNLLLTFQERKGDVFETIRERLRSSKGKIRTMGADYLAYCLIDATVDQYFDILEEIGERIETIEDVLVSNPERQTLQWIHAIKRELLILRKSVWPLREVINTVERSESPLIHEATRIYLRDIYDHTVQVIDNLETFRDMISGMLDIYLSSVSNKMNEIMKILTIIATIFIPITFISGVYGMNFKYMPELKWRWGYPATLLVMLAVAVYMLVYFRRKRWL